jgi:hypothetical protein
MKATIRKIGRNRGNARLWLEGKCLLDRGWTHGKRFKAEFSEGSVRYLACEDGNRAVAGSPQRPIIDTNTDKLLTALGLKVGDTVEVTGGNVAIIVKPAP